MAMATQDLSSADRFLKNLMGILALIFLVTFLVFALVPDGLVKFLNLLGKIFGLPAAKLISDVDLSCLAPEASDADMGAFKAVPQRLWLILSLSLMATLTYLCYLVWRDPRKHLALVPVVLLSKLVSSAFALIYFFAQQRYFANLVAFVTDFPIFLIVLFAYIRVVLQRERELVS